MQLCVVLGHSVYFYLSMVSGFYIFCLFGYMYICDCGNNTNDILGERVNVSVDINSEVLELTPKCFVKCYPHAVF